ncbi:MAG: acyloxyacyl hydrolase [Altibacter sp.]|uniref:acyloxyacyl hydrolase n=1 Tax=Altibacter sp. TaxID=2024823 RepID=UPI001D3E6915|nr:acyloxyacyl hydrolase [Altibacter sp.]MBZ0328370.1 acyloxyacyl hydrolase [Altibacter sp.]
MKYRFYLLILFISFQHTSAQQNELRFHSFEVDNFYGTILEHNPDISHLITGHPSGVFFSYNRKTYGFNEWERRYNHPDWGFTFIYQDMANPYLGVNYSVYGHFNWYMFNRNLTIRMAQGIALTSNPYDPETNYQNNAYGSKLLSSTFLKVNYVKENLYKGFGFHAGFGIIHYSNANFKAPNNSTNTLYFNAGLSYQFDPQSFPYRIPLESWPSRYYAERIHLNFVFRTGINEADVNGLGQYPFYTLSLYADKRINYKSTFQAGIEVFFSEFLIELIRYRSIAFPEDGLTGDENYRRVGVFIGHELRFNKTAFVSQLGYYTYWPYEFENRIYNRLGLKRYFYKDRFFGAITLKAHWAKAEAVEFGVGIRL